jgi:hypothetical protein
MHLSAAQSTRAHANTQANSNIYQDLCDGRMKSQFFLKRKNISVQTSTFYDADDFYNFLAFFSVENVQKIKLLFASRHH